MLPPKAASVGRPTK